MFKYARALTLILIACLSTTTIFGLTRSDLMAPKPITGPITITSPGTYKLVYNVEGQIIISVSNVSLNLNNYTITGTAHGIVINGASSHIEIEDGSVGPHHRR